MNHRRPEWELAPTTPARSYIRAKTWTTVFDESRKLPSHAANCVLEGRSGKYCRDLLRSVLVRVVERVLRKPEKVCQHIASCAPLQTLGEAGVQVCVEAIWDFFN